MSDNMCETITNYSISTNFERIQNNYRLFNGVSQQDTDCGLLVLDALLCNL